MVRLRRCLLILATLISGGVSLHGGSSSEDRAYGVAERAFNLPSWAYAEEKFGEFVQKYPKSPRVPGAILFQARARFQLNRFADVIALLSANRAKAGMWGDEYLYWTAQAHLQTTNFEAGADLLAQLCRDFPNSPRRLEAVIEEATALARLGEWSRVTELLEDPDGVLQEAASSDPTDAFVLRGRLLLGEAKLALKNFSGVQAALDLMSGRAFDPELMWRREYLRCRLQLALGQPEQALVNSGRLLVLAGAPPGTNEAPPQADAPIPRATIPAAGLLSESWSFRAAVLEQLNRPDDAIAAYSNNLAASAPVDHQRQALFKIAGLHLAQGQYALAIESLEDYLNRHPDSGAADMALLTIGELQLKQSELAGTNDAGGVAPAGPGTNLVRQALGRFDTLLAAFPHSPLTGKAFLDKGWCLWTDGRYGPSAEAFRLAAEQLPFSEDQAVARFKWADAQFMMQDYAEAATNYIYVVGRYGSLAGVGPQFFELALYQTVRAALPNDGPAATEALRKILESYPDGFAGPHALLFSGQRFTRQNDPAGARGLFALSGQRVAARGAPGRGSQLRTGEELGGRSARVQRLDPGVHESRGTPARGVLPGLGWIHGGSGDQRVCSVHEFHRPVSDPRACPGRAVLDGGLLLAPWRLSKCGNQLPTGVQEHQLAGLGVELPGANDGWTRGGGPPGL
jgi:TolA-binding protein